MLQYTQFTMHLYMASHMQHMQCMVQHMQFTHLPQLATLFTSLLWPPRCSPTLTPSSTTQVTASRPPVSITPSIIQASVLSSKSSMVPITPTHSQLSSELLPSQLLSHLDLNQPRQCL